MAIETIKDPSIELLDELTKDFNRLKRQKSRPSGSVESMVLQNVCFVNGEHHVKYENRSLRLEARDPNKLYLMFNMIGPRMGKLLGRLAGANPPFKANPDRQDPAAYSEAEVVDKLILALDQKLNQPARMWEIMYWLMVGGVAFEYVPWVPNASIEPMPVEGPDGSLMYVHKMMGQEQPVTEAQMQEMIQQGMPPEHFTLLEEVQPVGDVGSEILGPLNVFVDNSVRSIADLAPDQRVYIAKIRTMGWIEENFGKTVEPDKNFSIVSTNFHVPAENVVGGTFLRDLIPLIQGSNDESDMPMAVVVESFAPPSKKNPHGRYTVFTPGGEILLDEESPYDEIPIVDYHWKPVTTSFWTPAYITDLIPPQKFINKRISQLGEQSNATLYAQLLLAPGLTEKDIPADYPGVVLNGLSDEGTPKIMRLMPPELPAWYMPSIELVIKSFNDIAGGADLFQESKFPGQLRGPMAVPMLQEILDTEWGPLFNHLGERLGMVKQMRVNRVKQFYPPLRTLHYTNRDQKDEVMTFHAEKVLRGSNNFNISIQQGALMPELRALREARILERLNSPLSVLYMDQRTGRLDVSKISADLEFGDAGREGREAQYRKLGQYAVDKCWKAEQLPPVLPFYDHATMLDELEAAMSTVEYLSASPQVQQCFNQRYEQHRAFLMQEAQQQQVAMQQGAIHNAVAQATQQAAAMAAAQAVDEAMAQSQAQKQQPTGDYVAQAQAQGQAQQQQRQGPPPRKTRKVSVEEREG